MLKVLPLLFKITCPLLVTPTTGVVFQRQLNIPSTNQIDASNFFDGTITGEITYRIDTNNYVWITNSSNVVGANITLKTSVSIDNTEYPIVGIDASAFVGANISGAIDLTEANLTEIGANAFNNNQNLTSVNLGDNISSIGSGAFNGCLISNISLTSNPNFSLYSFSDNAKALISGTSITKWTDTTICAGSLAYGEIDLSTLPLATIANGAFYGCSNITKVTLPDSLTSIGDYAFMKCDGLTSIDIPASVKTIGKDAFRECTKLTSVNFATSCNLITISEYAFYGCNLNTFTIPTTVKTVSHYALTKNSNLTKVYIENPDASWTQISREYLLEPDWIPINERKGITIVVPDASAKEYGEQHDRFWFVNFNLVNQEGESIIPKDQTKLIVTLSITIPVVVIAIIIGSVALAQYLKYRRPQKKQNQPIKTK